MRLTHSGKSQTTPKAAQASDGRGLDSSLPSGTEMRVGLSLPPEFLRWFGDSKVVSLSGEPLPVYHGTGENFDSFSIESVGSCSENEFGKGFYFTPSREAATLYAELASKKSGTAAVVREAILSLQNPKFVTTLDRGGATGRHGTHDGLIVVYPDAENLHDPQHWAEVVVAHPDQIRFL